MGGLLRDIILRGYLASERLKSSSHGDILSHGIAMASEDPLDVQRILSSATGYSSIDINLVETTQSTNTDLVNLGRTRSIHHAVHIAEHQSTGKGRRGRVWITPYRRALAISLGYETVLPVSAMPGFSLAVGVGLCETLRLCGATACLLKWPNDVVTERGKLAGILVEHQVTNGVSQFVIGVGINISLTRAEKESILQPVVNLRDEGVLLGRNQIAGAVVAGVYGAVERFLAGPQSEVIACFNSLHSLQDRVCTVSTEFESVEGKVVEVGLDGALILSINGGRKSFVSGEVTVRPSVSVAG